MRVAVMGSGGVGGYFGARLAKGGADVIFVARGAHLAAMRERGLSVTGPEAFTLAQVDATEDPTTIGNVDLVIFAVKLWDTEDALARIKPVVGAQTTVISFQNGVLKDEMLAKAFGAGRIMGGVCYVATSIAAPGVIARVGPLERLVIGEFDGKATPRAQRLLEAFRAGGVHAELAADIRREIWQKFVFLVALSGTTTTMRSTIGPIRENPQTRRFLLDLMREVVAVGRAHGIDLAEDYAEQQLALADRVAPDMTSSMHHDIERGNRLEVRWLAGAVVELGRARNIATPLNRAVADILVLREAGTAA
ncbi:MAG: 2-dehydropantoate 2-reductase [Xanthobacteraceae bacterium]|nr:2-dehydropantoate 2-reductase [Xanthobacteraceae bacterium]